MVGISYSWDFSVVWEYRYGLLRGLANSVLITAFAVAVGTMIGVPMALGMLHRSRLVRSIVVAVVEVVRALPVLVALIWAYYLMPLYLGLAWSAFWVASWVLAAHMAAFAADVLRGAINAIPVEHLEAGRALGMSPTTVIRRIVVAEAFRRSVPALTGFYINIFKLSTLASVISVWELLQAGQTIILERFRPLEIYTAIAGLYLLTVLPLTYVAKRIERHRWFALQPKTRIRSS